MVSTLLCRYALKVPENLSLAAAAPLLCAGITTYSPLKHYGLDKPGMKLGVVGLGGLGHMAVKFGKVCPRPLPSPWLSATMNTSHTQQWCRSIPVCCDASGPTGVLGNVRDCAGVQCDLSLTDYCMDQGRVSHSVLAGG